MTGDVVNVTARIEKMCKPYGAQILVSDAVFRRAAVPKAGTTALGEVALPGRHAPIALHRLA